MPALPGPAGGPARTGAFSDAGQFLADVAIAKIDVGPYLAEWDATPGQAADRHLAELVSAFRFSGRRPSPVQD